MNETEEGEEGGEGGDDFVGWVLGLVKLELDGHGCIGELGNTLLSSQTPPSLSWSLFWVCEGEYMRWVWYLSMFVEWGEWGRESLSMLKVSKWGESASIIHGSNDWSFSALYGTCTYPQNKRETFSRSDLLASLLLPAQRMSSGRVYTINHESRHLIVENIPSYGVIDELVDLCGIHGEIEE